MAACECRVLLPSKCGPASRRGPQSLSCSAGSVTCGSRAGFRAAHPMHAYCAVVRHAWTCQFTEALRCMVERSLGFRSMHTCTSSGAGPGDQGTLLFWFSWHMCCATQRHAHVCHFLIACFWLPRFYVLIMRTAAHPGPACPGAAARPPASDSCARLCSCACMSPGGHTNPLAVALCCFAVAAWCYSSFLSFVFCMGCLVCSACYRLLRGCESKVFGYACTLVPGLVLCTLLLSLGVDDAAAVCHRIACRVLLLQSQVLAREDRQVILLGHIKPQLKCLVVFGNQVINNRQSQPASNISLAEGQIIFSGHGL
ncbi:hypothetical protein COO60DRAFT_679732 [Scenedesmus sp. NREL 46B-D3]|nr:hypothetical protein COO60DRAFT_679732 [Scenedesmus sp. NREL 46B-D3]